MTPARLFLTVLFITLASSPTFGQESDYDVKVNFEATCKNMKAAIDSARTTATLDSIKSSIDSVEATFAPREKFLNKAVYPETFAEKITNLRNLIRLTYDRVYLIQNQGIRIEELEGRIILLSARIDSLSQERNRLFAELQESKASLSRMRETIRKLTATMQAKDRLIFALIDSIFLPYDKNLNQITDVQKEAIAGRLLKANAAAHVYDIAEDNLRFLEATQLQPKDFANLIDQHEQFTNKWNGLRDKINAVSYSPETPGGKSLQTGKGKGKAKATATEPVISQTHVDSVLGDWDAKLASIFWGTVYKDLTSNGVKLQPFTDGRTFAASIRAYVDSAAAHGEDTRAFVEDVWKARIDKEWREALSHPSILGKAEYGVLDKYVSTLTEQRFDVKFVVYSVIVILLVVLGVWLFKRRSRPETETPPAE